MIKDKILKLILKSKSYVYRPANTKLSRGEKLVEFIKMYFNNHIPSQEEWHDFFVDLMKEYAISKDVPKFEICNLPLNKTDEEIEMSQTIIHGEFDAKGNIIRLSKQRIEELEIKTYSFIRVVNTLMHEMRHFYQFKARMEISGHVYQDMFENGSDFRGIKMCKIRDLSDIEVLFKLIHRATSNCTFVEEVLVKDETEQKEIWEDLSFGFYLNDPQEKDADLTGLMMAKKIYEELYEKLDKKSRLKLREDYLDMLETLTSEEHADKKPNRYFNRLKKDIKNLKIEELNKIGKIANVSNSPEYGLYLSLMDIMFVEDDLKTKLSLCSNAICNNCSNVLRGIFVDTDFEYKDYRQLEDIFLSQFKTDRVEDGLFFFAINQPKLIRDVTLKEMLVEELFKSEYLRAFCIYEVWMKRSYRFDEKPFINKILEIVRYNLDGMPVDNYIDAIYTMKDLKKLLDGLIKDSMIKEPNVQDILDYIDRFLGNEKETH